MYCLGAWNHVIFAMILDDLIAFTCILRIFEGSELVLLGAEIACTGFTLAEDCNELGPHTPALKKTAATPNYAGEKGPGAQTKATNTSREPDNPQNEIPNFYLN